MKTIKRIAREITNGDIITINGYEYKAKIWNNPTAQLQDPETGHASDYYVLKGDVMNGVMYPPVRVVEVDPRY